ncbi:MAG: ARMT1-like domain-containing protein, partial [Candidatus Omnitrophica bacterium]|nr:ARMT1-like domain-containing protein [Candidatus Omnitrophota bacterium]
MLNLDYKVIPGPRTQLSAEDVLHIWGLTGILSRLKSLKNTVDEQVRPEVEQAIAYIETFDGKSFEEWLTKRRDDVNNKSESGNKSLFDNAHFTALSFLWDYLKADAELLVLKRISSRETILARYGFTKEEAMIWLAQKGLAVTAIDELSEQDFINIIVGEAQTLARPTTIRGMIGYSLVYGTLRSTVSQARANQVPYRAIFAAANATHCPWQDELAREENIWIEHIRDISTRNGILNAINAQAPPQAATVTDLSKAYQPTIEINHRDPQQIMQEIVAAADQAVASLPAHSYQKYLYETRINALMQELFDAYQTEDTYTFFRSLVLISEFLVLVARKFQSESQVGNEHLNLYVARDAANYYLAGYILAADKAAFEKNNNVIHVSRDKLGRAHQVMIAILREASQETGNGDYWSIVLDKFHAAIAEDGEFKQVAELIYSEIAPVIGEGRNIRIIESMAEGTITGFVKALILYHNPETEVAEFIAEPKNSEEIAGFKTKGRDIETVEEHELTKEIVKDWLAKHGLTYTGEILTFAERSEEDMRDNTKILLDVIRAQAYHPQYPFSEVNLGHPIEHRSGKIVESSALKQIAFLLRQMLVINAALPNTAAVNFAGIRKLNTTVRPNDFLPKALELSALGEGLFNYIVSEHHEIFATASDASQEELLQRLAVWIRLMDLEGVLESSVANIRANHPDGKYYYQFERFIFELRKAQRASFDETLIWFAGRQGWTADTYDNALTSANALKSLRDKIAVEKGTLASRLKVSNIYGAERSKKVVSDKPVETLVSLLEAKEAVNKVVTLDVAATTAKNKDYLVGISATFLKSGREYQLQGLIEEMGNAQAAEYQKHWQKAVQDEFEKAGMTKIAKAGDKLYELKGERGSMLFFVVRASEDTVEYQLNALIDTVSQSFLKDRIKVRNLMSYLELPQDSQTLIQLWQALYTADVVVTYTTAAGNNVVRTSAAAIIENSSIAKADIETLKNQEKYIRAVEKLEKPNAGSARLNSMRKSHKQMYKKLINEITAKEKEVEYSATITLDDYLAYLHWARRRAINTKAVLPHEVLDLYELSLDELIKLASQVAWYFGTESEAMQSVREALEYRFTVEANDSQALQKLWSAALKGFVSPKFFEIAVKSHGKETDISSVEYESILKFIMDNNVNINSRGGIPMKDVLSMVASRKINIVGQARTGKSTLAKKLYTDMRKTKVGEDVMLVDIGGIYRAYAFFLQQLVAEGDTSVLASQENIIQALSRATVEIRGQAVYLNGVGLSDKILHSADVEALLANITKEGNSQVNNFLREKDREIVSRIPQSTWVIISSRGFYPHSGVNLYLTASIEERAKRGLAAEGIEATEDNLKQEQTRIAGRDIKDSSEENLRKYPGTFTLIDTTGKDETAVFEQVKDLIAAYAKQTGITLDQRLDILKTLINEDLKTSVIVLKGGVRGGVLRAAMNKVVDLLGKDFEVVAGPQFKLTVNEMIERWGTTGLVHMLNALKQEGVAPETIAVGSALLDEKNGWEFERWVNNLKNDPELGKLSSVKGLWFGVAYLTGNVKVLVIKYKGKEAGKKASYEALMKKYAIAQKRLQERMQELFVEDIGDMQWQNFAKYVIVGETNTLKSHKGSIRELGGKELKEGSLKHTMAEGTGLGLDESNVATAANVVHISGYNELAREMLSFPADQIAVLHGLIVGSGNAVVKADVSEINTREELREKNIPEGDEAAIQDLYLRIEKMGDHTPGAYEAIREAVNTGLNPAQVLENLLFQGKLLDILPELKELENVSYTQSHNGFNMFKHTVQALRRMYYIEEAVGISDQNSEAFLRALEGYKRDVPGASDLKKEMFIRLVQIYSKALEVKLTTPDRAWPLDKKLFLFLSILAHDIGKNISVQQHLTFAQPLTEQVFARLGYTEEDRKLAAFLTTNHSMLSTRINVGYETHLSIENRLAQFAVADRPSALAAAAMIDIADIAGVGYGFDLSADKISAIVNRADPQNLTRTDLDHAIAGRISGLLGKHRLSAKTQEVIALIEEANGKTSRNAFKEFMASVPLYYALPMVEQLSATGLANLLYVAFLFSQNNNIVDPFIYFFSEKKPGDEETKIVDNLIKHGKLWNKNSSAIKYADFGLEIKQGFDSSNKIVVKFAPRIGTFASLPDDRSAYLISHSTGLMDTWDEAMAAVNKHNKAAGFELSTWEEEGRVIIDYGYLTGDDKTVASIEKNADGLPFMRLSLLALEDLSGAALAAILNQVYDEYRTDEKEYRFEVSSLLDKSYSPYLEDHVKAELLNVIEFTTHQKPSDRAKKLIESLNMAELLTIYASGDVNAVLTRYETKFFDAATKKIRSDLNETLTEYFYQIIEQRTRAKEYNDAREQKLSGLQDIINLLEGSTGYGADTITGDLKNALMALVPESAVELAPLSGDKLYARMEELLMNEFRAMAQDRLWQGTDIIEVQMRSVAETLKLEEIKELSEERSELPAVIARLDHEARMLAMKALAGVAIRLSIEMPGRSIDSITEKEARPYFGVVAVIIASGEATRYSPDYGTHKGMESVYGTVNIHQVWQAVKTMSLGASPVIPLGMRYLGQMLKDKADYEKVKAMGGLVPEELIHQGKKARLVPGDAILSKKGAADEGGHGNQLIYAIEAYREIGELDNVADFMVHFAEHSPLALDTMINTAWVVYLEHLFGSAYADKLITAVSRQDDTIAQKGNFLVDSIGRLIDIADMHKVIIALNPDALRRGEALRRISQLEKDSKFTHKDMAKIKALLAKYKGKDIYVLLKRADDDAKEEIKTDLNELKKLLPELNEKALELLGLKDVDKDVKKDYLLLTYEQERLLNELKQQKLQKGFKRINGTRIILSKKASPYIRNSERYSVFDPGNLTFEFLAWDIIRMLRKDFRNLTPEIREQIFGLYPAGDIDITYQGYKSKGWESSGTKDRPSATKLLGEFELQYQRVLAQAGIKFDTKTLFVQVVTSKGEKLNVQSLAAFKDRLTENGKVLKGNVVINLDNKFIWLKDEGIFLLNRNNNIKVLEAGKEENNYGRVLDAQTKQEVDETTYTLLNLYEDYTVIDTDLEVPALREYKPQVKVAPAGTVVDAKKFNETMKAESAKGGILTYVGNLKVHLLENVPEVSEEVLKKLAAVFITAAGDGKKVADDIRLFNEIRVDYDSKAGFFVYMRNAEVVSSYIGRGWGLRGGLDSKTAVHNSTLVDHQLKDDTLVLLLPIFNHKFIDAYTSVIDSSIENSVVFPGAGITLRVEGGRTALVNVHLDHTVIPEGREVAYNARISGLMQQEKDLIERLYYSSSEEALAIIKGILAEKADKGRYASVAVAMIALPLYRKLLNMIDQKDQESVLERMNVIEPTLGSYLNVLMSGQLLVDRFPAKTLRDFHTIALKSDYLREKLSLTNTAEDEAKIRAFLLSYKRNEEPLKGVEDDIYFAGLFSHGEKKATGDKVYANYENYALGISSDELRNFAEVRIRGMLGDKVNGEEIKAHVEAFYKLYIDRVLEYTTAALRWITVADGYPIRDRLGNVQYLSIERRAREAAIYDRSAELTAGFEKFKLADHELIHPFGYYNSLGNDAALAAVKELQEKETKEGDLAIESLVKLAIAGGIFDLNNPAIKREYEEFRGRNELSKFFEKYIYNKSKQDLATADDYKDLASFVKDYLESKTARVIVYVFDNNLEGVFDLYLIQRMLAMNPNLTIYAVVKETNVSNDFSVKDVKEILGTVIGQVVFKQLNGLVEYLAGNNIQGVAEKRFKVVTEGPNLQGMDLAHLSSQLKKVLEQVNALLLTKGQANCECTQVEGLERLHILMSKGETIASFTGLHKDAKGMVVARLPAGVVLGKGKADTTQKCPITGKEITVPKYNLVWWRAANGAHGQFASLPKDDHSAYLISHSTGLMDTWDEAMVAVNKHNKAAGFELSTWEEEGRVIIDYGYLTGDDKTVASIEKNADGLPFMRLSLLALEDLSGAALAAILNQVYDEYRTDEKEYRFEVSSLLDKSYSPYLEDHVKAELLNVIEFTTHQKPSDRAKKLIESLNMAELLTIYASGDVNAVLTRYETKFFDAATKKIRSDLNETLTEYFYQIIEQRTRAKEYNDAREQKLSGLQDIINLLEGSTGYGADTITGDLKNALMALVPESAVELAPLSGDKLYARMEELLMNEFRAMAQDRLWQGTDIIEVQMRSVAETLKLEEIKELSEERSELPAVIARLDHEARMLAMKALAGVAIRLSIEMPGRSIDSITEKEARPYFGVVAVIIASGEATRYSPDYGTHKGMESVYGTVNIHQVWQAVKTMSLGASPVIPLGMRYLGQMLKDKADYEKVKAMGGLVPEELIHQGKKARLVPGDAILSKKGAADEGGHGNQLIYAIEAYREIGELDNVADFMVHFAEHSPLALDTMINTAWVVYLEHLFGSAYADKLITAVSRQDDTIAQKGNFLVDSIGRLIDIADMHKVIIALNPDALRRGEALRRISQLEKDSKFTHKDMAKIKALLAKYKGKDIYVLLKRADDDAKEEIKTDLNELKKLLPELNEKALELLGLKDVDKDVKKDYLLLTYEQERLLNELKQQKLQKGFKRINGTRIILSKKASPYIRNSERYSVFDPGNLTFEFLAWDIIRMLRKDFRNLTPEIREQIFGLYPAGDIDITYQGYKSKGWESSGTKDRPSATKLLGEFELQYQRVLAQAGIKFDTKTLFVQVVTSKGEKLNVQSLAAFKDRLTENGKVLKGNVVINLDNKFIWLKDEGIFLLNRNNNIKVLEAGKEENNYGRVLDAQTKQEVDETTYTLLNLYEDYTVIDTDLEVPALREYKPQVKVAPAGTVVDAKKFNETMKAESAKGGILTYVGNLKVHLLENVPEVSEEVLKKLAAVFITAAGDGKKVADDIRLFNEIRVDYDSKAGFFVYMRNAEVVSSYIGRGWGLRGGLDSKTAVHNSTLVDHQLKDDTLVLLLPIFNHKFIDAYTSVIDSSIENSVVFPGAGITLRVEGGRTALVNVHLDHTVIPEGREVAYNARISGLMQQEKDLIERLESASTGSQVVAIAKELLEQSNDPGRFTSLAIGLLGTPKAIAAILASLSKEDKEAVMARMNIIAPVMARINTGKLLTMFDKGTEEELKAYLLGYDRNDTALQNLADTYFAGLFSHGEKKNEKFYQNYELDYTPGVIKEG